MIVAVVLLELIVTPDRLLPERSSRAMNARRWVCFEGRGARRIPLVSWLLPDAVRPRRHGDPRRVDGLFSPARHRLRRDSDGGSQAGTLLAVRGPRRRRGGRRRRGHGQGGPRD